MEKIRVKSKTLYEIEVNDKGDKISFDTNDISLPFRFSRAYEETKKIAQKYKTESLKIKKQEDKHLKDKLLSKNEYANAKLINDYYAEMRNAMDMFLGEGGCQKVFGNNNWFSMFDDLFETLEPHLQKIGINKEDTNRKIAEKYSDDDKTI